MTIQRNWVTPIAAGAFMLSAATGVLMFFHIDTGLNKLAHEWLSWVLLGGAAHVKIVVASVMQPTPEYRDVSTNASL